jgi:phenylalanyl-tRNA synthetase alpha chain
MSSGEVVSPADWEKAFRQVSGAVRSELQAVSDLDSLEAFRVRVLGRSGSLTLLLKQLKDLPLEARRAQGVEANRLRSELDAAIEALKSRLDRHAVEAQLSSVREDLTLPGRPFPRGRRHPVTLTMERMASILSRLGFSWAEGPLAETDFYNFEALNFPPSHPARDLQDTFYLESARAEPVEAPLLMRTHTSPVQIRAMQAQKPPIRVIAPGRVFRHEAVDATHSAVFHQVEGLYIDKNVSMADLKGTLELFMKELFGRDTTIRFRPSYFPFVEPGAEVDVRCVFCKGTGTREGGAPCGVCKRSGFLEMLGAGLVHPNVVRSAGHDPAVWTGYAFGIGVERVALMLFGIPDIRMLYENDLRFLSQFG